MADPAKTVDQNILPVQALFNIDNSFNTFIGQGQPFIVSATESIGIQDVPTLDATLYLTLSPVSTGQVTSLDVASTKLTFNPSTSTLSVPFVSGALKGTADTATNIANGSTGQIPYQTSTNVTGFISNGTSGQVLTSNGSSAPSWTTPTFLIPITDDTTTNAVRYPLFSAITSGNITVEYTSSTKYQFNPSTGVLTATGFSGSGADLTSLTAANLSGTIPSAVLGNSNVYIGTTAIALNRTSASINLTGTSIDGSANSANTANTATNATNIAITDNTSSVSTYYPVISSATTGNVGATTSSTKFSFVPSTGTLTISALVTSGGTINNTAIGGTTAAAGTFTTLIGGADAANYGQLTGGATTKAVEFKTLGSDTNVAYAIRSKGTGAIDLAAGSSGVNISNGGTVTAITRTNGGTGYTVAPTVVISAPTTAGGVRATATCTVTAGVVDAAFTITDAGSGYVEQPTITFTPVSGGSGAAAYASVGAGSIIRSLGSTGTQSLSLYTPSGESLRIRDTGSIGAYAMFSNTAAGVTLLTQGTSNAFMSINSNGTSSVIFGTNGNSGTTQMSVAHTASAVNFVQVTGAATTAPPAITVQGSDTNIRMNISSKGTESVDILTNNTGTRVAKFTYTASSVNWVQMTGSVAGNAPVYSVAGTDTNIDLTLTPKGTGVVQFGTYTATVTAVAGYILIKDAGGTTRKLAVLT